MITKQDKIPTSYSNSAFNEDSTMERTSGNPSPMGSNIFIVKPDDGKMNRSHPEPYRNEPVTKKNIGRMILQGVRCKLIRFVLSLLDSFLKIDYSTLGNTANRKRSWKK